MGEQLGFTECVAIALGGIIGGIYAVLGVVARLTGAATWFAFVLAGVVGVELLYFEREVIERALSEMEDGVESRL